MDNICLIIGNSVIDGRPLFLGAGYYKEGACESAYGSRAEEVHEGHELCRFTSIDAAIQHWPEFEEDIHYAFGRR